MKRHLCGPTASAQLPTADPTASLVSALHDFESVLSEEEKHHYNTNTSAACQLSVIAFVADVDAGNRGQRCVAPRLCTFLENTQQFVGIVDTFVSSKPQIAALV